MQISEEVTFGGGQLERAAELRGKPELLDPLRASGKACAVIIWRGKLLVTGDPDIALTRLPTDHPAIQADWPETFLGRDGEIALFGYDASAWEPEDLDASAMGSFIDATEQVHPDIEGARFAELRRIMTRLTPLEAEIGATLKALREWHRTHKFCSRCGEPSDISMSGWQRNCGTCGAPHFPRTDPVAIMLVTHGNKTLLGRSPGWPEGMYSCLAGFVEPGETIEGATRREVFEEAGVRVGAVRYVASQPWAFPNSLMFGTHAEALTTEINIDPNELEDAMWVTKEELVASFAGENPMLLPARRGAIAQFLLRNWLADRMD